MNNPNLADKITELENSVEKAFTMADELSQEYFDTRHDTELEQAALMVNFDHYTTICDIMYDYLLKSKDLLKEVKDELATA